MENGNSVGSGEGIKDKARIEELIAEKEKELADLFDKASESEKALLKKYAEIVKEIENLQSQLYYASNVQSYDVQADLARRREDEDEKTDQEKSDDQYNGTASQQALRDMADVEKGDL
ncbi:MAG: hypothetical protein LBL08_00765 [Candidatus Nomurabacteria bacterium]|jgi:hypothetical protein|nr:hypothetical protein [Candidatus Nomurabacteria bacterium]